MKSFNICETVIHLTKSRKVYHLLPHHILCIVFIYTHSIYLMSKDWFNFQYPSCRGWILYTSKLKILNWFSCNWLNHKSLPRNNPGLKLRLKIDVNVKKFVLFLIQLKAKKSYKKMKNNRLYWVKCNNLNT